MIEQQQSDPALATAVIELATAELKLVEMLAVFWPSGSSNSSSSRDVQAVHLISYKDAQVRFDTAVAAAAACCTHGNPAACISSSIFISSIAMKQKPADANAPGS